MTEDLLGADQKKPDLDKNYLEELVGEGKKFKSEQDLAKGKFESDLYIKTLEERLDEMRVDLLKEKAEKDASARLEELMKRLETRQSQTDTNTLGTSDREEKRELDPKLIEDMISNKISENERKRREDENFNQVKTELVKRFGDNYQTALKEQIDTLGLTNEFVNNLARTQPNAAMRLFGLERQANRETFQSPPRSEQRNDSFAPKTQKRTWAYYQELKKKDPQIYYDPKIAVQIQKDAIELGEAFRDGDYYVAGLHEPQ